MAKKKPAGVEFIVLRGGSDELTFARVTAKVKNAKLQDEQEFLAALQAAVADWVRDTAYGWAAWEESERDFNVGDLAMELYDRSLRKRLRARGILNLQISCYLNDGACRHWVYDTHLVPNDPLQRPPK